MASLTFEQLIDLLPMTGRWSMHKTGNKDPEFKYFAKWEEMVGAKTTSIAQYGETPRQALEKLVIEFRGPIQDLGLEE